MKKEFTILFCYKNEEHKAGVVRTDSDNDCEYDVRPTSPELVRRFGKQIRIFRTKGDYKIEDRIIVEDKEFYTALIQAIHRCERGKEKAFLKVSIKKEGPVVNPQKEVSNTSNPSDYPSRPKDKDIYS